MVSQLAHEVAGVEIDWLQSALKAAHSDRGSCVCMDDGMGIGQSAMEQAMLNESGLIDMPWVVDIDLVAINVDLDQAGSGDLTKVHAIRIDQKSAFFVRHLHRNVVKHQFVPTEHRKNAIAGRKLLTRGPFGFAIFAVRLQLGCHWRSPAHSLRCFMKRTLHEGKWLENAKWPTDFSILVLKSAIFA
jgi:hypothetical protein